MMEKSSGKKHRGFPSKRLIEGKRGKREKRHEKAHSMVAPVHWIYVDSKIGGKKGVPQSFLKE